MYKNAHRRGISNSPKPENTEMPIDNKLDI